MRELPILFSASMVRAILAGRKHQTRRLMKPQPEPIPPDVWRHRQHDATGYWWSCAAARQMVSMHDAPGACPHGTPGDRLWVRETWAADESMDLVSPGEMADSCDVLYIADDARRKPGRSFDRGKTRVSIHMPRWASRITLEVTDVRVERLNDISEDDAEAEGVAEMDGSLDEVKLCARAKAMGQCATDSRVWFAELWDSINGKRAPWSSNPWVWAVSFRVVA